MWETMHTMLITATIISAGALAAIYLYLGWLYLKAWLFDRDMPDVSSSPVSKVVCRFGLPEPWVDTLLFCICLMVGLSALGVMLVTGLWKLVILAIFAVAGLHALRWGIRIKRTIDKIKSIAHKHSERKEQNDES